MKFHGYEMDLNLPLHCLIGWCWHPYWETCPANTEIPDWVYKAWRRKEWRECRSRAPKVSTRFSHNYETRVAPKADDRTPFHKAVWATATLEQGSKTRRFRNSEVSQFCCDWDRSKPDVPAKEAIAQGLADMEADHWEMEHIAREVELDLDSQWMADDDADSNQFWRTHFLHATELAEIEQHVEAEIEWLMMPEGVTVRPELLIA